MGRVRSLLGRVESLLCLPASFPSTKNRESKKNQPHRRYHSNSDWPISRPSVPEQCPFETFQPQQQLTVSIGSGAHQWSEETRGLFEQPSAATAAVIGDPPPWPSEDDTTTRVAAPRIPCQGLTLLSSPRQNGPRRRPTPDMPLPCEEPMDTAVVREVLDQIGLLFSHVPYCVSGRAAMSYHGLFSEATHPSQLPDHISLLCPSPSRNAILCWAFAQGAYHIPGRQGSFGVRTEDGDLRLVRVKFMDRDFGQLSTACSEDLLGRTRIMTLPGLASQIALAYCRDLSTGEAPVGRQRAYAVDLCSILRRIVEVGRRDRSQRLTHDNAGHLLLNEFWIPFTCSFPDTIELFRAAGLDYNDDSYYWSPSYTNDASLPGVFETRDRVERFSDISDASSLSTVSMTTCATM